MGVLEYLIVLWRQQLTVNAVLLQWQSLLVALDVVHLPPFVLTGSTQNSWAPGEARRVQQTRVVSVQVLQVAERTAA